MGISNLWVVWRGLVQGLPARCSVRKSHWLFLRALATPPSIIRSSDMRGAGF